MRHNIICTFLTLTAIILITPTHSYAKQQACADFEKHFQKLSSLERQFSTLKHKKIEMEGARSVIKEVGTDLLEARVPLVAMDPQKKRPNHLTKCRSASEEFTKELQEAQESLAELRAFGPMMG